MVNIEKLISQFITKALPLMGTKLIIFTGAVEPEKINIVFK